MKDYEDTGHMTKETIRQINSNNEEYYFPHHPVIRESSLTTKVRVVFDGSAKTSLGTSLNDKLLVGPNLQEDLVEILLRFRTHEFVITADIEKMFRQINIATEDKPLQKILWREDPTQEIQTYTLNTVAYGTTCAPFLAMRCLRQLAEDEASRFPKAAEILCTDFYMDQEQLAALLETGRFNLRKWRSNSDNILKRISEEKKADSFLVLDKPEAVKTLGLLWNSNGDVLQYSIQICEEEIYTKRNILSRIAQIYDPLGLVGPILLRAKFLMQQLWKLEIGWDDEVPQDIDESWRKYYHSLPMMNQLRIDRNVNPENTSNKVDLHGFSDASEKGYGACIYAVSRNSDENFTSRLMCSKSKVAPIKQLTLPRLELNAAVLLARLVFLIRNSLKNKINKIHLWSDSTIVLYWIKTPPEQLKTFVANRIVEIQEYTYSSSWAHVSSLDNPADAISRGVTVENLLSNQLWWEGPPWICNHPNGWTKQDVIPEVEKPELRTLLSCSVVHEPITILTKYSSYEKLLRVIAYVRRFYLNTSRKAKLNGSLTTAELEDANTTTIFMLHQENFAREISELKGQRPLKGWSQIQVLKPWIDEKGLLRVGGRLKHAEISSDQKNPILLPCKDHVTELIMRQEHERLHHCGPEQLSNSIRQKYWPISGRREARKITRRCITCFRYQPKKIETIMADLPKERLTQTSRPFDTCGIDYAGPLKVRESKRRGRIHVSKAYIAVFTCFHTKAVHLELVSDLTTEAFLAALQRFVARREICRIICSMNF